MTDHTTFDLTTLRVERTDETRPETEGHLLGKGVEFPSGKIILEWNLQAFAEADRLKNPHQSIYGSREDVEQATGGRVVLEDGDATETPIPSLPGDEEDSGNVDSGEEPTAPEPSAPSDPVEEPAPVEEDGRYVFSGEGFQIRSTVHTPAMRYSFRVEGVTGGESLEDADSYTETEDGDVLVEGTVGPRGSDTYYLEGRLSEWSAVEVGDRNRTVPSTRFDVAVAGEVRELWDLLGLEAPLYDDTSAAALGGGAEYSQKVTEADADVVVSSHGGLRDALEVAEAGDVVFVDGDAEIYSPGKHERYIVPAGVTLASDRGVDGSTGGLLHTDSAYSYGAHGLVSVRGDDARVTGLRIRGPHPNPSGGWRDHSYDYEMAAVNARAHSARRVEIDNCEMWGFAHLAAAGADGHVHHNHLHHANMKGLGYCCSTGSTEGVVFEFNYCEHWRHVVAASGKGGYTARFNLIDPPGLAHAFDQHRPGGTYTKLHHNTYRVHTGSDVASGDPRAPFATFRGDQVRNAEIFNNWSFNEWEPRSTPSEYFTDEFITKPRHNGTGWEGVSWWDNHLGQDDPGDPDKGCPR